MEKENIKREKQIKREFEMKSNSQAKRMSWEEYYKFRIEEIRKYYEGGKK